MRRIPQARRPFAVLVLALAACTACWTASPRVPEGLFAFAFASSRQPLGVQHTASTGPSSRRSRLTQLRAADDEDYEDADWTGRMRIEDLQPGQQLNGIVNIVAPYGCFVDVGAERDGLVHVSRVSRTFVEDLESVVQPGQAVQVWVTEVKEGKLSLTMVPNDGDQEMTDDLAPFQAVSQETWLEANVMSTTDFGAFVTVKPPDGTGLPAKGLVHISQIKDGFVEHPSDELKVGQKVMVRVLDAVQETGRLRVSMRQANRVKPENQDLTPFASVDKSTWLKGRVCYPAPFGVFVEVAAPGGEKAVQGLVHITEIRDGFVDDPHAEVKVDQEVNVRVVGVDERAGRLSLSMKPEAPEA